VRNKANWQSSRGIGGASPTLRADTIAPNKPNFQPGQPTGRVPRGRESAKQSQSGGDCAKQSQFARLEGNRWGQRDPKRDLSRLGARPTLQVGSSAPNKAKFGQPGRRRPVGCAKQSQFRRRDRTGKCLAEKDLWRIEHAGGLGETKPISRWRISDCGLRIGDSPTVCRLQPAGAGCTTKANWWSQSCETRPNSGSRAGRLRQTKPIPGAGPPVDV